MAVNQPAFTCSKLTIETLDQGVKYVQSYNKGTRTTPPFWCLYCQFEHISHLVLVILVLTLNKKLVAGKQLLLVYLMWLINISMISYSILFWRKSASTSSTQNRNSLKKLNFTNSNSNFKINQVKVSKYICEVYFQKERQIS